jgi:hypothetical protein
MTIVPSNIGHNHTTPRYRLRKRWFDFVAISGLVFFTGWLVFRDRSAAKDTDKISEALVKSSSFRSLQKRVNRPAALVDREDETYFEFILGENFPDRFVGMESVRINKKTFQVSKLTEDEHLEFQWIAE